MNVIYIRMYACMGYVCLSVLEIMAGNWWFSGVPELKLKCPDTNPINKLH